MTDTPTPVSAAASLELVGSISLRSGDRIWGTQRRLALLAAIGAEGSISAAAKKVDLSYKAAWDAVDAMNNLAGEALVVRVTGGRRGGGARLTARAIELIELYRDVSREHERFMAKLAKIDAHSHHNLELIQHMMIQTSARNNVAGVVEQIKPGVVNDEVILGIGGDRHIVASITKESVQNLGLSVDRRALAFIKASSVLVGLPGDGLRLSARNQLHGRINRIVRGKVSAEVCIEIAQGSVIAAVISNESVKALTLKEGDPAIAIFKASSVMLGILD